jgi:hypothetical protein
MAARVIDALNRPDPVAGVGDINEALALLGALSLQELVDTLLEIDDAYLLDVLVGAVGSNDQSEVGAAIYAVRFTSPHGSHETSYGVQAAKGLAQLPEDKQEVILAEVLARRGAGATIGEIREGMEAILESEAQLDAAGYEEVDEEVSPPTAPLMAGVVPGPWNPGKMPVPYYLGNAAHVGIAAEYATFHRADAAFYNYSPIASILDAARALGFTVNPLLLKAAKLGLKPDITNLTRRHLYEIKPAKLQSVAAAEARMYMAAFIAAGLPITLGPVGEQGTTGTIPAPGGWYIFSAPQAGVVTYRYRQPKRRRSRGRARNRSKVDTRSMMRKMEEITGLTGVALIIYLILSEGSRVFPPRNLVPVP